MFKQAVNACICNAKAALNASRNNDNKSNSAALAYLCQAHSCVKQIQLFSVIEGTVKYDKFYDAFIDFNNVFIRMAANKITSDILEKYNVLLQEYDKLTFVENV